MSQKKYHDFLTTFEKKSSERLPEHQAWDHGIELNEDFKPRRSVNYSLTIQEQELLDEFLEENYGRDIFAHLTARKPARSSS